jgi:GGDEF domain-containing protein
VHAGPASANGQVGHDGLIDLLHDVATRADGLDVIDEAIRLIAEHFSLQDLVVAVDTDTIGMQIFRLKRDPIGEAEFDRVCGGESFISVPDVVPATIKRLVAGIADAAIAVQLARRHQVRDPWTGLLTRGVFNEALRSAGAQSSRYGWTFTVLVLRIGGGEEPGEAEVRRLGHAFARALRSGDAGGRLRRATFMALLPNASAESPHALVRRFMEESGTSADAIDYASATAPNDSVDPAELFRLAASRMRDA